MSLFCNGINNWPSLQDQSSKLFLYFASVIGSGKNFVHDYNLIVYLFSRNPLIQANPLSSSTSLSGKI